MSTIMALLPAAPARAIERGLDDRARHLATRDDETRTLAQLRADIFADLLTRAPRKGDSKAEKSTASDTGAAITATVNITIPAMTLLGHSNEPATLDGYGPIDLDTAKRLAGTAPSWVRVLTHPVTRTILDVDRKAYKVPADLRRWLGIRYPTCIFPGCTRSADGCDMDHRKRWVDGGTTSAENLGPECGQHHPIKDDTRWMLSRDPGTGQLVWRTPSGYDVEVDPPPF